ncbi:hypothetical protein VPHK449_0015 [Vibrio phage K449]
MLPENSPKQPTYQGLERRNLTTLAHPQPEPDRPNLAQPSNATIKKVQDIIVRV